MSLWHLNLLNIFITIHCRFRYSCTDIYHCIGLFTKTTGKVPQNTGEFTIQNAGTAQNCSSFCVQQHRSECNSFMFCPTSSACVISEEHTMMGQAVKGGAMCDMYTSKRLYVLFPTTWRANAIDWVSWYISMYLYMSVCMSIILKNMLHVICKQYTYDHIWCNYIYRNGWCVVVQRSVHDHRLPSTPSRNKHWKLRSTDSTDGKNGTDNYCHVHSLLIVVKSTSQSRKMQNLNLAHMFTLWYNLYSYESH